MRAPSAEDLHGTGVLRRVAPFWLLFAAIYIAFRWPYIAALRQADPDDTLRLVQVRDLLAGQGWYDLHQYRIDPPHGVVMHWSRLVDLPIAGTELLLRPLLGAGLAEQVASVAVPLLTFAAILWLVARLVRRLFDDRLIGYAALLTGTSFPLVTQILPTRVDHHGWQIVAALGAMLGLTDPDRRRGGVIAGAALALGMTISLELLPLAVLFAAVLALGWLRDPSSGQRFTGFVVTLAGTALAGFAATRGPDWTNYCDAVSPVYLAGLAIAALGSLLTARLAGSSPWRIAAGLGLTGLAAGAAVALIAPPCLAGPFSALDPLLQKMWHDNVLEGLPVWNLDGPAIIQWLVPPLAGLCASVMLWRRSAGEQRQRWFDYALVVAGSYLLGVMVLRSMSFAIAFAVVPLAWLVRDLVARLETTPGVLRKLALVVLLLVCVMPALFAGLIPGKAENSSETAANASGDTGDQIATANALNRLPAGTIFAPLDDGPAFLLRTHHTVVATGHHRGATAMHDVMTGFLVDPPVARTILARHGVRYVVLATDSKEVGVYRSMMPHGFAARLTAGDVPDWLTPLPLPKGSGHIAFAVKP